MLLESKTHTERMPSGHLVHLDAEHPGFRDPAYRQRRDQIARVALAYRRGAVPCIPYGPTEHEVWAQIVHALCPLHREHAFRRYNLLWEKWVQGEPARLIPQLQEINVALKRQTAFRMLPVAGLIDASTFLKALGEGVFLSTQYIRHPSRPFYTPEPDIVHEILGHAITLMDPEIAALSRLIGRAAASADEAGIRELERVYWHTLEFGAVFEEGRLKAFGAGLLSSVAELQRMIASPPLPWNLWRMSQADYDPSDFQPRYYAAPSLTELLRHLGAWVQERFRIDA